MCDDIACNTLRNLIHLAIGVFVIVIHHRQVVGRLLHLLAEQRNDGLGIVVRHIRLVEAVEQSGLFGIQQRDLLQRHLRLADESLDRIAYRLRQTLHQFMTITAIVIFYHHTRHTFFFLNVESNAELRRIQFKRLYFKFLTIDEILVNNAHLIGKHDFGRQVVIGGNLRKGIFFVRQRLVEVLAGLFQKIHHTLFANLGTQSQRVDKHARRVADAQVGAAVADGGDADLLVVGETRE